MEVIKTICKNKGLELNVIKVTKKRIYCEIPKELSIGKRYPQYISVKMKNIILKY